MAIRTETAVERKLVSRQQLPRQAPVAQLRSRGKVETLEKEISCEVIPPPPLVIYCVCVFAVCILPYLCLTSTLGFYLLMYFSFWDSEIVLFSLI